MFWFNVSHTSLRTHHSDRFLTHKPHDRYLTWAALWRCKSAHLSRMHAHTLAHKPTIQRFCPLSCVACGRGTWIIASISLSPYTTRTWRIDYHRLIDSAEMLSGALVILASLCDSWMFLCTAPHKRLALALHVWVNESGERAMIGSEFKKWLLEQRVWGCIFLMNLGWVNYEVQKTNVREENLWKVFWRSCLLNVGQICKRSQKTHDKRQWPSRSPSASVYDLSLSLLLPLCYTPKMYLELANLNHQNLRGACRKRLDWCPSSLVYTWNWQQAPYYPSIHTHTHTPHSL